MDLELPLTLIFMLCLTGTNCYHYSTFNFIYTIMVFTFKYYKLYPIAMTNTLATVFTWYSVLIYDNTFAIRMIQKNNWTLIQFITGDVLLHLLPCLIVFYEFLYNRSYIHYHNTELVQNCGLYSMFLNLSWAIVTQGGFTLNTAYVPLPIYAWNFMWIINILAHIGSMLLINYPLSC
jgi:hypothetical protein